MTASHLDGLTYEQIVAVGPYRIALSFIDGYADALAEAVPTMTLPEIKRHVKIIRDKAREALKPKVTP